ncbi:MlaC/ttg2D family ABC transporter substrate-binding protein [Thalassolituus hydrocarboniclasticus]|uniref:ABC transporter substrate-binding protein n=1 Tax=Thalassolituus hydrocarboniclasticus TaxID=2742796 RepID=A0ABY6A7X0_9GAMM|nr:ABC transporter substrate-binding protein [Thalassolituus hydrocarboniclasticus]UXD86414.1 ABC transporter substrate-binding protein [Thalassolituus hydrocarboniclasticus]
MRSLLLVLLLCLMPWAVSHATGSGELAEQAHDVVRAATEKVVVSISKNRDIYETDKARFFWELEDVLGPMVDFQRLTRRIMGSHYRDATPEQRKRFAMVFKRSLLDSYALALLEFDDYQVRVLPPKTDVENTLRNTLVDLEVVTSAGQVFPITQSMYFHHHAQRWMAQNVIVNGINVGKLFAEQFEQMVQERDGDIGAAIESWSASLQEQGRQLRKQARASDARDKQTEDRP